MEDRIVKVSDAVEQGFREIRSLQKGDRLKIKTGDDAIDSHIGGLIPGDSILLAAGSGIGKSQKLYDILDNILDVSLNPNADNYVSLEYSFEMKILNKLIRKIHNLTHKKKSLILSEDFTEQEKEIVKNYNNSLKDDRRFLCQHPIPVEEFKDTCVKFIETHKDKEAIIISVDHCLLFKNKDKMQALQTLTDAVNDLKLEYNNVYFILLSQLNRNSSIMGGSDRDNSIFPTTEWIYGSSTMEFLSDYILILVNAFKAGIDEYLRFNPDRYDYLSEYFSGEDKKGKQSFNTMGNLFTFTMKARESDNHYQNIHIQKMSLSKETLEKMEMERSTRREEKSSGHSSPPDFEIPVFNPNEGAGAITKASWGSINKINHFNHDSIK